MSNYNITPGSTISPPRLASEKMTRPKYSTAGAPPPKSEKLASDKDGKFASAVGETWQRMQNRKHPGMKMTEDGWKKKDPIDYKLDRSVGLDIKEDQPFVRENAAKADREVLVAREKSRDNSTKPTTTRVSMSTTIAKPEQKHVVITTEEKPTRKSYFKRG